MSAKWRALQHRHRYTYSSVIFPKSFIETLDLVPSDAASSFEFFSNLKELISLTSTYSQISAAKSLSSAFAQLLSAQAATADTVSVASKLYLEILFLENSLPLHRTLISPLTKNRNFLPLISRCFESLCEEYGDLSKKIKKRFVVSRAALSLMGFPKLGFLNETVEKCSVLVANDVRFGLMGVISDIECGSRPSPVVMEQCQEAMSCLYYLLQRFPTKFLGLEGRVTTFDSVVRTILNVLKSSAFSRDCLVAAGVSFCAAIQACMSHDELSSFISKGFFGIYGGEECVGDLGAKRLMPNGDLYLEIRNFSVLSRLCLLRGIVTAIPRTVLNTHFVDPSNGCIWTILYNGILTELCKYCEKPTDSHFNFHALTVTQIGLQQIKTSILGDPTGFSVNYSPIPEEMMSRIIKIIWNNLEDTLSQTVKQVHLIFDLLLDIEASIPFREDSGRTKVFLFNIVADLLCLGSRCKGRYMPLASVTKRLGAKSVLDLNPNLISETIHAYVDDDVCCSVTSFLKCFLECLRDECWSHDGIEKGYETFRGLCLPPLLHGLVSGQSKLRSNLNTYALPAVLEIDADSIFHMLAFISIGPSEEENKFTVDLKIDQCVAALVSLLKVSRMLALLEGDIDLEHDSSVQQKSSNRAAVMCVKGIDVRVPVEWFILALTHADESLRIDAAESLFMNPKTASLPSTLELSLMREAVPLNMRCCATSFQMKWTSLFRKFFYRVRTALERQVKQGLWKPVACIDRNGVIKGNDTNDVVFQRAENLFHFMKWLSCFLLSSCYPSAPYERKTMAMELILIMVDVWPTSNVQGEHSPCPYSEGFTSPESTLCLVGSIIDSWDRLRENSFRILLSFPTPLPGIFSPDSVKEVIKWAKKLVCSPRVRESDAGALAFRLIFRKYVLELQWIVGVSDNIFCLDSLETDRAVQMIKFRSPVVEYISSLVEWLHDVVVEAEKDLLEACRNSFVHGVLLTLRYTFEELDWNSEVFLSSSSQMRCILEKLLQLVMRVTSLALWVVSADAWHMPYDMDDVDDGAFLTDEPLEMATADSLSEPVDEDLKFEVDVRPTEQVVMVGCWLAMKEISLLLGTITRKIPLPSCLFSESFEGCTFGIKMTVEPDAMLDSQQLETIGNHFLQVLLKMKHNGAIDKTRAGFSALCNRLLCSNDPRLCKMTESWIEQLMERTIAKGQTVDDLLRRSAGIPAAFIALFLSEPEGTPKKLLPRALRWLIDVANMSLCNVSGGGNNKSEVLHNDFIRNQPFETSTEEVQESGQASKIRDEGVIPTVHAFNVLRAAFNDTNLATDTSGFCAEALIVAIRSFSSPYWEVRNSACLAYTALVRRMIGFLNIQKHKSARRALTGLEFFHRYPSLHPFLSSELKIATELLSDGCSRHAESNIAKAIHPSLCPILILLARLTPSLISCGTDDALDPYTLLPFIQRCATQSNLRVRVLASRALVGLVSNEKLQDVLCGVARGLPCGRTWTPVNMSSNGDKPTAAHSVSFNAIHGILLQLLSLLDNNLTNLTDMRKKDHIVGELTLILLNCSWIGNVKSCPCPTLNCSFLRVLDQMLGIAITFVSSYHVTTIQKILLDLASECLETHRSGPIMHDPTRVELRRQAATSYFGCLFAESLENTREDFWVQRSAPATNHISGMTEGEISVASLHERILSCISDATYEVRVGTLKKLFQLVASMKRPDDRGAISMWAETCLQSVMMLRLAVEENQKCIYYILKIIFSWHILRFETTDAEVDVEYALTFWKRLVLLNSTVTRCKTREILMCCMAISVKQLVLLLRRACFIGPPEVKGEFEDTKGFGEALSCISYFVVIVEQCSLPSEPVNTRKAAAEAMVASGLLSEASLISSLVSNSNNQSEASEIAKIEEIEPSLLGIPAVINFYAGKILDLWFTCIQLLEDEDLELRQKLANDVQKYVNTRGSKGIPCNDTVSSQVDQVIESSFVFLSAIFGHWFGYLNYLCGYVLNAAGSASSQGDLVRRIFDKEIDNHHEEKLLICQICCSHLEKLLFRKSTEVRLNPQGSPEGSVEIFVQSWRLRFIQQLVAFAKNGVESDNAADWIGGIGNHKDAFTSLYANLLGIYALTQCHLPGQQGGGSGGNNNLLKFAELREIIRPFLRNPLISNLYFLVIKSQEKRYGVSSSPECEGDCSIWEGFDPYFLVR